MIDRMERQWPERAQRRADSLRFDYLQAARGLASAGASGSDYLAAAEKALDDAWQAAQLVLLERDERDGPEPVRPPGIVSLSANVRIPVRVKG